MSRTKMSLCKTDYGKARAGLGFIGECLAKEKFESLGHKVTHKRNSYDLVVDDKYRIEVKTAKCTPTDKGVKRWNLGIYSKQENSDYFLFVLMPLANEVPLFILKETSWVLREDRKNEYSIVFREDANNFKDELFTNRKF